MPRLRRDERPNQAEAASAFFGWLHASGVLGWRDWWAFLRTWPREQISLREVRGHFLFAYDSFTRVFCVVRSYLCHSSSLHCIRYLVGSHIKKLTATPRFMTIFHVAIIAVCMGIGVAIGTLFASVFGQAYLDAGKMVGLFVGLVFGLTPYPLRTVIWLCERMKRPKNK